MNNLKKFAKYLAIPAVLLLMAIPLTGATSNAIYLHHQRLTLANLEADLQNREIGLDFENKTIVGRYADGTYVHLLSAEQPNVTIGGTLGVVGPITGSSTLTLSTLTANKPLFTNGSSVVTTAGVTGYGTTVVLDSLPTLKSPTISGTVPGTVGFTSGTFSGTLGVTGLATLTGGALFNTSQSINAGMVGYNATAGLNIRGSTGSVNDVTISSVDAGTIFANPTGTRNVMVGHSSGTLTFPMFSSGRIPYFGASGLVSQDNLYWDATNDRLGIGSGASSPSFDLHVSKSSSGSAVSITANNSDNTSGSSNARILALAGGASGGDPYSQYTVTGGADWAAGIDNSDGDAYVITPASTPGGATNGLKITTGGAVSMPGTLGVTGAVTADTLIAPKFYEEGSFTATLTGVTTTVTGTAYFTRIGKAVTLRIPSLLGTSNTTAMTVTGMPSQIRPSATTYCFGVTEIRDNGLDNLLTRFNIATSGVITPAFATSLTGFYGTVYTSSSTKGLESASTVHYTLQ